MKEEMVRECCPSEDYKDGIKNGFIIGVNQLEYEITTDRRVNGRIRAIVRRAKRDLLSAHGWGK